jgi:4-oxalmesaconate hydratase
VTMIIDCHGHYTVLPKGHDAWREEQKAAFKAGVPVPAYPEIGDAEIRETIESNQLRLIKERGPDDLFAARVHHGAAYWRCRCREGMGDAVQ